MDVQEREAGDLGRLEGLADSMDLDIRTLSKQLRALLGLGLLDCQRRGPEHVYSLSPRAGLDRRGAQVRLCLARSAGPADARVVLVVSDGDADKPPGPELRTPSPSSVVVTADPAGFAAGASGARGTEVGGRNGRGGRGGGGGGGARATPTPASARGLNRPAAAPAPGGSAS